MIIATLTYEEMHRRHPAEVAEILTKLRKGKSKVREEDPATFTWAYHACLEIKSAMTLAEIFGNEPDRRQRELDAMSLDEKVADIASRTTVSILAKIGRWWGASSVIPNPPEVEINAREGLVTQAVEQARVDTMTPEERSQEVSRLLAML